MNEPIKPKEPIDMATSGREGTQVAPRGDLPPEVEAAARTISRAVWGNPYKPGEGSMHWAGGPYWGQELRRLANKWERMAVAARVCAGWLPDADCDALGAPNER